MFKKFWDKRRKENSEPEYISLCFILEGSGEDRNIIENIFDKYVPKNSFVEDERNEMVDYLYKIAKDQND